MKKLSIILILVIIIFASLLGYFYFFRSGTDPNTGIINTITSLFPGSDSRNIAVDPLNPNTTSSGEQGEQSSVGTNNLTSKFQPISNNSITGASLVTIGATSTKIKSLPTSAIWYIEKATGYVFSYNPNTGIQKQLTNTTWVGGQETYWGEAKGSPTFILRRSKNSTIENYLAKISNVGSTTNSIGELTGLIISPDISTLVSSPKKDRYFYLVSAPSGSIGYLANFSGAGLPTQVFTSPYPKWQVTWPEENTLIFQSAPLSDQTGLVYSFNLKTKAFTRLLGGVRGLTILSSPDGKKILYANNSLALKVKTINKDLPDLALGVTTLPEKCVWAKDSVKVYCAVPNSIPFGNYPDIWYRGLVNFSDSLWEINTLTGATKQIYNPASGVEKNQIDGIKLFLANNETKLFLTNKTDYILWQLNLVDSFNTTSTTTDSN
jgi:hypothetical protein